jgi:hypothetical protein
MSIVKARAPAQQIAFGPMVFQAVRVLWKSGVLKAIDDAEPLGPTLALLSEQTNLSLYALGVLLEIAESSDIFSRSDDTLSLTKTGRWALRCLKHESNVEVTIADLPHQLSALRLIWREPTMPRVQCQEVDLLAGQVDWPVKYDVIWMSQFLDCFSEEQIEQILASLRPALGVGGRIFIMETFVDRQRFEAATYSLNAISLYFTAMANGNSRMYRSETIERLLHKTGLRSSCQPGRHWTWPHAYGM